MKKLVSRTSKLLDAVDAFLMKALGDACQEWNAKDGTLFLPPIVQCHHGYCEPMNGLTVYPSLILIVQGRDSGDAFFSTYRLTVGIAIKCDDSATLVRWGEAYEDILEDVVDSDHSLGGAVLDVNGQTMDKDLSSGTYLISLDLEAMVDRGGYVYAENEYDADTGT